MNSYDPALAGVVGRLSEARLRLVAHGVLRAALWALTAGLAIFAALELLRRLLRGSWENAFGAQDTPSLALAAILAAAVVLAGGVAVAILRAPPIEQLARRADQTFGLRERISTALEIEQRAGRNQPAVVAAMIADALRQSEAVNPAALAAVRLPRSALLVPIAALAAAAVIFLVPTQPVPVDGLVASHLSATLDATERAAAVEDISRVADVIAEEARTRGDAYMQAVANTLEDLGERIAMTPETTRGDILEELGTLLDYATAAGSGWHGTAGERIPQVIEALEASIAQPRTGQPKAGQSTEPLLDESDDPSIDPALANSPTAAPTSLETVLEDLARQNGIAQAGDPNRAGANAEILDYIKAAQARAAPQNQANPQQTSDNAQMFGAQADAGAAENTLAGDGTEAIGSEAVAQRVDFATTSEMVLTGEDAGEGRSLEIEITPDAKLTEITEETLAADTGAWRRTSESEAARYAIGIDDRDTVSRYLRALLGPAQK